MKVVLFNCRFGANLGDQFLVECLAADLLAVDPEMTVVVEDLGGREKPSIDGAPRRLRLAAMSVHRLIPGPLRRLIAHRLLQRLAKRRLRPRWHAALADADAIVVGGGGIFADSDLNFPVKISTALAMANERKLPVAVHAVGVGAEWSQTGKRLIAEQLVAANLCRFSVRDERAQSAWNDKFAGYRIAAPEITPDPAFTASGRMSDPAPSVDRPIAICLTSISALRYHADDVAVPQSVEEWYVALAAELAGRGHKVVGFTTGSVEDVEFASRLSGRFVKATNGSAQVLSPFENAAALVGAMRSSRAVVGHRLHALIAAYNWHVPGLALAWDRKMRGQMDAMGYPERLINPSETSPAQTADRIEAIIDEGIDPARSASLSSAAHAGTVQLVQALHQAVRVNG